ncbi:MAG: SDR family oxidoreductase [Betaproteobacteria bacterium]|nr:SDR family oxidoreductase [Betaproteobacteria bacterium]
MTRKFALITGGSRGLGAVLVRRFWLGGYNLGVVSRNEADIHQVVNDLPQRENQTATSLACDLGRPAEVAKLIERVKSSFPKLDVLLNNAAIQGPIGTLESNDMAEWQRAVQVNLLAPVALCQGLIPALAAGGGGAIINLSGGGATGPRANFSAYAAAKAGLVRFSETLAEELKPKAIRVNSIAPGAMKTAMLGEVLAKGAVAGDREFGLASKVFEEGGASMDRVADLALFLASDAADGITGKLISAVWDNWDNWPQHLDELSASDVYTLRRITGRDRGMTWGDK